MRPNILMVGFSSVVMVKDSKRSNMINPKVPVSCSFRRKVTFSRSSQAFMRVRKRSFHVGSFAPGKIYWNCWSVVCLHPAQHGCKPHGADLADSRHPNHGILQLHNELNQAVGRGPRVFELHHPTQGLRYASQPRLPRCNRILIISIKSTCLLQ